MYIYYIYYRGSPLAHHHTESINEDTTASHAFQK